MRLPTLEELEACDSEVVAAILREIGAPGGATTAEMIQKTLTNPPAEEIKVEAELMALLAKLPRFANFVNMSYYPCFPRDEMMMHAILFGLRVGYKCGQHDALKLLESVDK